MFSDSYSGKTVLITGHTGFKGSWMAMWLLQLGANVIGYALESPTDPNLFESSGLERQVTHIQADIRDTLRFLQTLQEYKPDFIFHLAAFTQVRDSYADPVETFDVNVMGTISVLDALRQWEHPCVVIIVSTDKCYENREWVHGYRESDTLGGYDPYSASKAAMEIAVNSYRLSFFTPENMTEHRVRLASGRAGNVIGGGDWSKNRIVPDAIRALSCNSPFHVRNPQAVRPWQHVLEPLSGYLWLAARMAAADGNRFTSGWNFGPQPTEIYTVADLADAIIGAWGDSSSWHTDTKVDAPHEADLLRLCIDKARFILGWQPVWDFSVTVKRTVAWYRQFLADPANQHAVQQACLDDIEAYQQDAARKGLIWAT